MNESLFSQAWYRVAPLKPRLRSHVRIFQHSYRGQDWFVIQDRFTGRHHRFSPEAYQLIGLMDGRRTLGQIWETACQRLGDHMPTQDEVIGLLAGLYRSDLLQTCALTDFAELRERRSQGRRNRLLSNLLSPLSVRFPLLDPDRFLTATLPWIRPFLGRRAFIVWLLTVGFSAALAVLHWADLTSDFTDSLLSLENLVLISLVYPVLKVIHEFGHAYLVKKWGGEVHEMGIMLLVFMPIPYVEASASLAFADKRQRMLVGAAGILIELFVAALGLLVWLNVEPGVVRATAYNVMLIAGVSTLLFNGNPLLRFDAYYVLADYLEIPNLGQRSTRYLGYCCQRWLLGLGDVENPASTPGEAAWLLAYALASFVYRIFISIRIILFVAGRYFFIGLLLSLWAFGFMAVMPLWNMIRYLVKDVRLQRKRLRVGLAVVLPVAVLIGGFLLLPFPFYTSCEGVTWAPEDSRLYAGADGFVTELATASGSRVEAGTALIRNANPELDLLVQVMEARLKEYQARYQLSLVGARAEAVLMKEELERLEAELEHARQRREGLLVRSPAAGVFVVPQPEDLPGRFFKRGTPLGYVLDPRRIRVRVLVPQDNIEQVRTDTQRVELRLADRIGQTLNAVVVREVPAASRVLPSLAFSLEGGGQFAIDPREKESAQVLERLFQFDLQPEAMSTDRVEERVFVRFEHTPQPLVWRVWWALRRLLLSRFAI
jgi:putative peptide zinc metalloprotease protein